MLDLFSVYIILDISYVIILYYYLHIKIVNPMVDTLVEEKVGTREEVVSYMGIPYKLSLIVSLFVAFPLLFPVFLVSPKSAVEGYTKSVMINIYKQLNT